MTPVQPVLFDPAVAAVSSPGAALPAPELQGAADRFSRMMAKEPDPNIYAEQRLMDKGSPATAFIAAQERTMQGTFDAVRQFTVQAPQMNVNELAARQVELSYQVAMTQMQFNAGVYVAQSSKNGLQTLMKNQ